MHRSPTLLLSSLLLTSIAAAQGADDCSSAQVIAGPGPHFFDNTAATKDGPNDCDGLPVRKDVWFRWTAPLTGGYVLDDCGTTSVQTRYAVYDFQACPVTSAPLIPCGQTGCAGMGTHMNFPTVAGQEYLIRMGSKNINQAGTGTFDLIFDPCWLLGDDAFEDNDSCEDRVPLDNGTYTGLLVKKEDRDWYEVAIPDGATAVLDVFFTNANGNIETWLWDGCGGNYLQNGGSITDDEPLSWTNNTGACVTGIFMVEILVGDPNECNNYDMIISGLAAPGSCSGTIGTTYCDPANVNSSGMAGVLTATGSETVADNDVLLTATQLPVNQFGFFLNSKSQGAVMPPGSSGILCLSGAIGRYNAFIQSSGATGEFELQLDLTDTPTPGGHVAIQAGETWYFQSWYRDVGPTNNFTDGVCITFN